MRVAALGVALAVCGSCTQGSPLDPFTLVIDDGRIAPTDASGQPWCAGGTLSVSVTATVGEVQTQTPVASGLEPTWNSAMMEATVRDWHGGLTLTVVGQCDGAPFPIAALTIHPSSSAIRAGRPFIVDLGPPARVRLHFEGVYVEVPAGDVSDPCTWDACTWPDDGGDTTDTTDGGGSGDDGDWMDPDPGCDDCG